MTFPNLYFLHAYFLLDYLLSNLFKLELIENKIISNKDSPAPEGLYEGYTTIFDIANYSNLTRGIYYLIAETMYKYPDPRTTFVRFTLSDNPTKILNFKEIFCLSYVHGKILLFEDNKKLYFKADSSTFSSRVEYSLYKLNF